MSFIIDKFETKEPFVTRVCAEVSWSIARSPCGSALPPAFRALHSEGGQHEINQPTV